MMYNNNMFVKYRYIYMLHALLESSKLGPPGAAFVKNFPLMRAQHIYVPVLAENRKLQE